MDDKRKQMLPMFRAKDFESMWVDLNYMYDKLGFKDAMTDSERITEYKWIVQQLRKYMFSRQDLIIDNEQYQGMIDVIDSLIGSAEEYGDDRKHVVYNFMRDHWLFEVRNYISMLMQDEWDDSEEDE